MFSVLLDRYVGVELLGHFITLGFVSWELPDFSEVAAPLSILLGSVRRFQFLHILSSTSDCPFFFLLFVFLGPHLQHMQVPRLGVESKLQLLACATAVAVLDPSHICDLHHSSRQRWILNPLSGARD